MAAARLRLLHVIPSTNPLGGGPAEALRLLRLELIASGVDMEIVSCDSADAPWLSDSQPVHTMGPASKRYRYTRRMVPWLRANAFRFDAVIVHGIWQYHSFAVWRALAKSDTPYFVFTHGMLAPWFKRRYPLKHAKKWAYWPFAEYRVLRDARAVLFTCKEEQLHARDSFWLYRANELVSQYGASSPPSAEEGALLAAFPDLKGKRLVLFVGRMHEVKGCDLLLEAFAQVASGDNRLHLMMAGPDQTGLGASLQTRAKRLGLESRITWPGMITGALKWDAFRTAEVFCLPSHHENFGIVVAEALGCGTPVLISNKVNIWREIETDGAGFVDEDSMEGTVRNLQQWLSLDSESYSDMSERALSCFTSRFKIQAAAKRLVEIIEENAG